MNPPSPPRRIALHRKHTIEDRSETVTTMPVFTKPSRQCLLSMPPRVGTRCELRSRPGALDWIPVRAQNLADVGASRGKNWTLAEACEHLALGIEATVRGSGFEPPPRRWLELPPFKRFQRWIVKRIMLATGWFPSGVGAPSSVAPTGTLTVPEAIDRLQVACEAFEQKCASPGASWGYHSILGKMSSRSWRRFHSIHAAHHFSFFRSRGGH